MNTGCVFRKIFLKFQSRKANTMFAFLLLSLICQAQVPFDTLLAKAKERLFANDYYTSLELYTNCLKEAQKLKDGFKIGNSYIGIGICYDKTSDFENALNNYFKGLAAYESVGNVKKEAGTLKNIGNTYRILKSYEKSYNFFGQALQKYGYVNDSAGLSSVSNDLGLLYLDQEKQDTAIRYFTTVITTYKKYAVKEVYAYALNNLGLAWSKKNDFKKSYSYYSASLEAMKKMGNDYGLALVVNNIGNLLIRQKKYAEALDFSKEGLATANKVQSKETIANSYENLATCYRELKEYQKSNDYFDKLLALRDTIFREESAKSYAEMESRYQNEKKQKEIILLKKDNAIKDLDITNQRRTRTFLLFTLVFIFAIAIVIYRSYSVKNKLNNKLNMANEKLNEANQSKTKLLSIISHDLRTPVSSLFNFLHLQKSSPGRLSAEQQEKFNRQINSAAENVLTTMEDLLIWSKSQMEKFEPVMETVDLDSFCDEIMNMNVTAAANKNIELTKSCKEQLTIFTDPNFLKISVRNLVGNAIKFTPPGGSVQLIIQKAEDTVSIIVKDTGGGIAEEYLPNIFTWNSIRSDSSGLGLRLAKEFTEKLNGTISVRSQPGKGTEFILSFDTEKAKKAK